MACGIVVILRGLAAGRVHKVAQVAVRVQMVLVLFDPGMEQLTQTLRREHVRADGDLELFGLLRILLVAVLVLHDVHLTVHLRKRRRKL